MIAIEWRHLNCDIISMSIIYNFKFFMGDTFASRREGYMWYVNNVNNVVILSGPSCQLQLILSNIIMILLYHWETQKQICAWSIALNVDYLKYSNWVLVS